MRFRVQKLIRDRLPAIMRAQGLQVFDRRLNDAEFIVALKDKLLVPEATVEHAGIKDLIAQLEGAEPEGEMYDAKVKVLSEYVKHHVEEEHDEMFPKVKASSLDLVELGAQMAARKADLLSAPS